ncbi:hypothetical protein H6P81_001595 [Aristolochia fimbriata]|uniref:Uncharacterized protein n=1 Tax=Aristolochia fimbriata TaxID=158543 RepID=A0AAV7F7F4_ARIFI|nr:hypothetical protein H6P81_001595 [Aristolochia fimbriata]
MGDNRIIAAAFVVFSCIGAAASASQGETSIIFTTLGRSRYAFDIYSVRIDEGPLAEVRLTDGRSVNFNGHFPSPSSAASALLPPTAPDLLPFVYVSERNGTSNVLLGGASADPEPPATVGRRSILEEEGKGGPHVPLLSPKGVSMKDRPMVAGDVLVYVSTHEDPGEARKSWAAVYSTHLGTGETARLTPVGIADFSPAVSPSGEWTAVASSGERGWDGEIDDLKTGIYVFKTRDGSGRRLVAEHGGWPVWADESTIYFHRPSEDGWWSVYRASGLRLLREGDSDSPTVIERVTPPGLHAFTPAVAPGSRFVAVATRRPSSDFRHIELFDTHTKVFDEITKRISPRTHHYNPFLSPDGTRLGYHRCRGGAAGKSNNRLLLLENRRSPVGDISLFRVDGSFPSFSPDGNRIAYTGFPGLYVANVDGSARRLLFPGTAFSTAWDPKREGVVYASIGPVFAGELTEVDVASFRVRADGSVAMKRLTRGGENNAFPSPSPDGTRVVFRSGRSGHKNLYIMDAAEGEAASLWRLTEGNWTDTMCNWSPDGKWIAFASDRERAGSGDFAIYFVRPDGSGLRKAFESGPGGVGRANHPWFSPDAKRFVFTSDHAAVSAEPVANPHHYQPYGDIFVADVDGSHATRLTHNSYEDGTPSWGRRFLKPNDVVAPPGLSPCVFDDCHFLAKTPNKSSVGPTSSNTSRCGNW